MAAIPYMQFHIADYLADTQGLTTIEHGAYLLLIMNYYQTGKSLVDNDQVLSQFCRTSVQKWLRMKPTLEKFFSIFEGRWYHKRIENDLDKIAEKSMKSRNAALSRWANERGVNDDKSECERNATAMRTQCDRNAINNNNNNNNNNNKNINNNISSEGKKTPPELVEIPDNNFISLHLVDKTEFHVTEDIVCEFESCYPAVNIREELKKMRAYFFSNPVKRKTRKGIMKSINSWLSKNQDSGSRQINQSFMARPLNNVQHNQLVLEKIQKEEDAKKLLLGSDHLEKQIEEEKIRFVEVMKDAKNYV